MAQNGKRMGQGGNTAGSAALAAPVDEVTAGVRIEPGSGSIEPLAVEELTAPALLETPGPSDGSATRLLAFDDLPEADRPAAGNRVLLVGLVWGGTTLVELEQLENGRDLPVRHVFELSGSRFARRFPVVKHVGDRHVLTLPASIDTEIHSRGELSSLEQKGRRVEAPFKGWAYEIGSDDRIVAQISPQLTLVARYVRARRQADKGFIEQVDIPFASTLLVALLAFALFFVMVAITPPRSERQIAHDLSETVQRYTKYQPKPPEKIEQPRFQDLGAKEGEKSKGDEGKLGKPEAKKKEADPSRKGQPNVDPAAKKRSDVEKVRRLGLVSALSKMGVGGTGATENVLGPGGLGAGINNSLGGTRGGAGLTDAYGVGGTGTRGTGTGGGGNALGIGGLGTKGSGHGRGGYGDVDLGGHKKEETVFVPGRTTVVGGLNRDVINRVIQKHYSEIKYCYEKELTKDPGLYGKVTVLFIIGGTGRVDDALVQQSTMASEPVESCIVNHVKRWAFPEPQGGGTVQVTYPYVFKAGAQ